MGGELMTENKSNLLYLASISVAFCSRKRKLFPDRSPVIVCGGIPK